MKALAKSLIVAVLSLVLGGVVGAQDLDAVAPVVIKAVPEAGSSEVAPGEAEIRVTFSKVMADGSWSWVTAWKDSVPEMIGKPHFETDHKTCVIKVKLEAGKTYGYWLNSEKFMNFKDAKGRAAVPYLLVFRTKG